MEIILGMAMTVWIIVAVANGVGDIATAITGNSNPRIERHRQRMKSRGQNPAWDQIKKELTGWLGDVVADARVEANRRREEKRERQAEARRQRDRELHPTVDAEYTIDEEPGSTSPEPGQTDQEETKTLFPECEYGAFVENDDCGRADCRFHGRQRETEPTNDNRNTNNRNESEDPMAGYEGGLDRLIAYLDDCSTKQMTFISEGVISGMTNAKYGAQSIAMVRRAQELAAQASAAFAAASSFVAANNKGAQERTTSETADKDELLNR